MKKRLFVIGLFTILIAANANISSPQPVNAWRSFRGLSNEDELEFTLISETKLEDSSYYNYKYHIKNVGNIFITEFHIEGPYVDGTLSEKQYKDVLVENNIFDYQTLVIGPNQEVDVDFLLLNKFSNLDEVKIIADCYTCDFEDECVNNASLTNNILSSRNSTVHLKIDEDDYNYNFYAFLKTTIDNKEYYFVADKNKDYVVSGNYGSNGIVDLEIELVKVIKRPIYRDNIEGVEEKEGNWTGLVLLVIFAPLIAFILGFIILGGIIALCVFIGIRSKRKNNSSGNNNF